MVKRKTIQVSERLYIRLKNIQQILDFELSLGTILLRMVEKFENLFIEDVKLSWDYTRRSVSRASINQVNTIPPKIIHEPWETKIIEKENKSFESTAIESLKRAKENLNSKK